MSKYHFLLILHRILRRPRPHGEWPLIAFSILMTTLIPLVTSDFKDALGVEKAVWETFTLYLAWSSGVLAIALFGWWAIVKFRGELTPEAIYEEIVAQMERDTAAALARSGQPLTPAGPPAQQPPGG